MNIFNLITISRYVKPKLQLNTNSIEKDKWKEIGKYIKKFRKKRGYSQLELASIAGVSNSHISRVERGIKSLSYKTAKKLGKALSIKLIKKKNEINSKIAGFRCLQKESYEKKR